MLCRAVPCFAEFSLSCIPEDNASKRAELASASMHVFEHFIHLLSSFSIVFLTATNILERYTSMYTYRYVATNSSTAVYTSIYAVEPRAQQSIAKHSKAQRNPPCTRQQTKFVPIRVRTKNSCTYMHAASRMLSWSVELVASASHLFAPKMLDHLLYICL